MEGNIGEIRLFAGNFAPRTWAFCDGSLQSITTYSALFSLVGISYGGDGIVTFGLPDFRGRMAVGAGQGPSLSNIALGQTGGSETKTLIVANLPAHTHSLAGQGKFAVNSATGDANSPVNNFLASSLNTYNEIAGNSQNLAGGIAGTTQLAGNGDPINTREPYLGLNFIICLEGIFPSRN
jgi:microcystin-dependent protein